MSIVYPFQDNWTCIIKFNHEVYETKKEEQKTVLDGVK